MRFIADYAFEIFMCSIASAILLGYGALIYTTTSRQRQEQAEDERRREEEGKTWTVDLCIAAKAFETCANALPKAGPRDLAAAGNDWAEAVEETADSLEHCQEISKAMSRRLRSETPRQCQGE